MRVPRHNRFLLPIALMALMLPLRSVRATEPASSAKRSSSASARVITTVSADHITHARGTGASAAFAPGRMLVKLRASSTRASRPSRRATLEGLTRRFGARAATPLFRAGALSSQRGQTRRTRSSPADANLPDLSSTYLIEVPADADIEALCRRYAADPRVAWAQPDYIATAQEAPNDPYYQSSGSWGQPYEDLWNLRQVHVEPAWALTQGNGITVAVIDTGLDASHPDITGNVWVNLREIPGNGVDDDQNGYVDDTWGWNFVQDSNDPRDDGGHGTHVAGIIAAVGNNHEGIIGVAPHALIMTLKGLDRFGQGQSSRLARAIVYAADAGADIINVSWGSPAPDHVVQEAVQYASGRGAILIAAAGNTIDNTATVVPASLPDVITVGASDLLDQRCWFSNFGVKLDVVAPGCDSEGHANILSLLAAGSDFEQHMPENRVGTQYVRLAGTSMAAPHVSGVAALILSRSPNLTREEVRQVLRASADSPLGFNENTGYGRVNAQRALNTETIATAHLTAPAAQALLRAGAIDIRGTAAGATFQRYDLSVADTATGPWRPIDEGSQAPVTENLLGRWQADASGSYYVRLVVTATDGHQFEDRIGPVFVDAALHAGWPLTVGPVQHGVTPYTVIDLNADGRFDIVIGALDGMVHAFQHDGTELAGWPIQVGGGVVSDIVCADVDADGLPECFFAAADRKLYGVRSNGQMLRGWPQPMSETDFGSYALALGDVAGDRTPDIVVIPSYPAQLRLHYDAMIFRADGTVLSQWPLYDILTRIVDEGSGPALVDLDGDGASELLVPMIDTTDGAYSLEVMDAYGNSRRSLSLLGVRATIERQAGGLVISRPEDLSRPVVGDLDGDNQPEIVISRPRINAQGDAVGRLFIWSSVEGRIMTRAWVDTGTGTASQAALGDLDRDGQLEIVLGGSRLDENGRVTVDSLLKGFHADGSPAWSSRDVLRQSFLQASPIIGPAAEANAPNVLIADLPSNSHRTSIGVYQYHSDGRQDTAHQLPGPIPWSNYAAPAVADLDGDGRAELIAVHPTTGLIAVWDLPARYNPALADWPQFQHDPQHSGRYVKPRASDVNRPPRLTASGPFTIGETIPLTFRVSAADPDGDSLTYRLSDCPRNATCHEETFTWTPQVGQAGLYQVAVRVTDGRFSDQGTVQITVLPARATISGRCFITVPKGRRVSRPRIPLGLYDGTALIQSVTSDRVGSYRFEHVPPGTYKVVPVRTKVWRAWTASPSSRQVTTTDDPVEHMDFVLRPRR